MGKTAETVIVLSFAYFSQFPPQFSPCENCALIVQTTLWHFSSLVPPLPLQNKFFYLHYARSSIHSCGNFRCSLIRVLLAVSAAVFAAKTAHSLFKQRYGILYPLFRPSLQNKFSTYITLDPLSIAVRPVLTYSRMPNGSRSFIKLSILSSLPVASTITESTSTSTMCAR